MEVTVNYFVKINDASLPVYTEDQLRAAYPEIMFGVNISDDSFRLFKETGEAYTLPFVCADVATKPDEETYGISEPRCDEYTPGQVPIVTWVITVPTDSGVRLTAVKAAVAQVLLEGKDRIIRAGAPVTIEGNDDVLQCRDYEDDRNWTQQGVMANCYKHLGVTDKVLFFKMKSNTVYYFTPDEFLNLMVQVHVFQQGVWKDYFDLKATLANATTEVDAQAVVWPPEKLPSNE